MTPAPAWAGELAAWHRQHGGPGTLLAGPAGHCLAPAAECAGSDHLRLGTHRVPRAEAEMVATGLENVIALRVSRPPTAAGDDRAACRTLGRLRETWTRRLLGDTIGYLGARRSAGSPLLDRQLVQAAIADTAIALDEAAALLSPDSDPPVSLLRFAHRRITDADRMLGDLLGAYGFTATGPGVLPHVSELLADAYLGG